MDKPQISYFVLTSDNLYARLQTVYAGSYTGDGPLSVNLRIWNNYQGTEDVEDLKNFNLVIRFLTEEDNALLPYVTVAVTDSMELPSIVEKNAAVFHFVDPISLSGEANTGSDEYYNNYVDITVTFDTGDDVYLKDHDLKSMVLEIAEI